MPSNSLTTSILPDSTAKSARSPPSCTAYSPGPRVMSAAVRASRSRSAAERPANSGTLAISSAVTMRLLHARNYLTRHELDLAPLVAQRPDVHALAARLGVAGQQRGTVFRGADADLRAELVRVAPQKRREDLAEHAIDLALVLGTQVHIVASALGKPGRGRASRAPRQAVPRFGESLRRRVVRRREPPVPGAGDAAQSGVRAPAPDPQRNAGLLPGGGASSTSGGTR